MLLLPDLPSLGVFVAAALLLLVTPGPAVLYIVARSIEQGRRAGLVSMLGVHAGTLVHVFAAAAGLSALLAASATAFGMNVLNPKTALFFLAFLPQFADVSRPHVGGQILALGLLFVLLGLCTDGLYALGAGTAAHWLRGQPRFLASERWVSGSMYIGLGVAAALSSGNRK
jgi:threonine/homoserine/homoserine lactone efflux protein